jgi:acid stress-induced BolA-like protein IbaG/YrbA
MVHGIKNLGAIEGNGSHSFFFVVYNMVHGAAKVKRRVAKFCSNSTEEIIAVFLKKIVYKFCLKQKMHLPLCHA